MSMCDAFSSPSYLNSLQTQSQPLSVKPPPKDSSPLIQIFVEKMSQGREGINYPFKRWKDEVFVDDIKLQKVRNGQMCMAEAVKENRKELRITKLINKKIPLTEKELANLFNALQKLKRYFKENNPIFPVAIPLNIKSKPYQLQAYLGEGKKIDIVLTQPADVKKNDLFIASGGFKILHHGWTLTGEPKHIAVAATQIPKDKKELLLKKAENEATLLNKFQNSSVTPKIYKSTTFMRNNGIEHVILMKYFPVTLCDRIHKLVKQSDRYALTDKEKLSLAYNIAKAVAHFHSQGIVHKDLKLDNILEKGQQQVLCDLGLSFDAKCKDQYLDRAFTYSFLAPEMLKGTPTEISWTEKHSYALDTWSLGCLLWIILSLEYFPWHKECKERAFAGWKEEALRKMSTFAETMPPKTDKAKTLLWHILKINPLERLSCEEIKGILWIMLQEVREGKTYNFASEFQKLIP